MAQAKTNARSEAKTAATQSSGTSNTGDKLKPGARPEGAEGAEATADQPAENRALIVITDNPKRKGSKAYGFFEKYPRRGQMSTIDAARYDSQNKELVRGKDLTWDTDRRHVLVGDEASNFPVDGTREEQAAYLLSLPETKGGFRCDEKFLIKHGYMDAPQPEVVEETTTEAATQNA